ncbi:MAG: hypothetical protein KDD52_04045, partial [Bdellovibrionales bacterium]|nr:hypothetical protein [Bdellovibrionales bacterium]
MKNMYFFCALLIAGQLWAQEPSLPAGLGGSEPSLPQGLGSESGEERSENHSVESWKEKLPFELSGFMDTRWGHRLRSDPLQDPISIAEFRLHHELEKDWKEVHVKYSADFLYDPVWDAVDLNLNSGTSWFDLREAHAVFRPFRFMDIKIGRQILTWGTGDLIFINDLFPKDWVSFFVGRDLVYLKAPSDAIKLALFSDVANLDIIYTPQFDSDRYISGQRISFYSQGAHSLQGQNAPISVQDQEQWFSDDEISIRLYRSIKASTIALYYYRGFWKSPAGFEPNLGKYTFPELSVYGASVRGPFANGIAYVEGGYYDSMKDREGTNPLIRNSELRVLGGYEKEIFEETTLGVQ